MLTNHGTLSATGGWGTEGPTPHTVDKSGVIANDGLLNNTGTVQLINDSSSYAIFGGKLQGAGDYVQTVGTTLVESKASLTQGSVGIQGGVLNRPSPCDQACESNRDGSL